MLLKIGDNEDLIAIAKFVDKNHFEIEFTKFMTFCNLF